MISRVLAYVALIFVGGSVFAVENADTKLSGDNKSWFVSGSLDFSQIPHDDEPAKFRQPNGDWGAGIGLHFGEITKEKDNGFRWHLGVSNAYEYNYKDIAPTGTKAKYLENTYNVDGGVDFLFMLDDASAFYIGPGLAYNMYSSAVINDNSTTVKKGGYGHYLSLMGNMGFSFFITENFGMDLGSKVFLPLVDSVSGATATAAKGPDINYILDIYLGFTGYID